MIAALSVHPDQVRHYAQDALNSFDTLDEAMAIENAKDNLKALLGYLDRFADYAVPILGTGRVEPWIRLEGPVSDREVDDLPHLKGAGSSL